MNQLVTRFCKDDSKKVLEKDMLFATLETSVRQIDPPGQKGFLLSDTVGFIDKLPHNLVKAFRSTLQEVQDADLLLHVLDFSDPDFSEHIRVTRETLEELSASHIPVLYVYNKADKLDPSSKPKLVDNKLYISAKQEVGIDALLSAIDGCLSKDDKEVKLLIPFSEGQIISILTRDANILSTEYLAEGTLITVKGVASVIDRYLKYEMN